MAWIYFQELEEYQKHSGKRELELLHIVKKKNTHKAFYCQECDLVILMSHQYGTTLEPLEKNTCQELILYRQDSLVRTSVLQEMVRDWMESEVGFSLKSLDSLGFYDQVSCSWKMSQLSLTGDSTELSWNCITSGLTVDGILFQHPMLVPHTLEKDSFYLPTPVTVDTGSFFNKSKSKNSKKRPTLGAMAKYNLWPTPTVCGNYQKPKAGTSRGTGLATAVGGLLNPTWVEWLMGYNMGHTELDVLVTQWFQSKSNMR